MLLDDNQLVRLAEKGSVPIACKASCVSVTLSTVMAGIFLLACFPHSLFLVRTPHQHHFSCVILHSAFLWLSV